MSTTGNTPSQCQETVWEPPGYWHTHQCPRRAKRAVEKLDGTVLWLCTQHANGLERRIERANMKRTDPPPNRSDPSSSAAEIQHFVVHPPGWSTDVGLMLRTTNKLAEELGEVGEAVRVYVASKSSHAEMWQGWRKVGHTSGFRITSSWIDEAGPGESILPNLWRNCITEARDAEYLVAYHETGEEWKGAFVEIGAHLAGGGRVLLVGDPPGSWVNHPEVRRVDSTYEAFDLIATGQHVAEVRTEVSA